jgi:predicted transcriptional regulator of viral defense system
MNKHRVIVTPSGVSERRALKHLKRAGIARSRDLVAAGVPRTQIRRLADQGSLKSAGRGLYRSPAAPITESHDLARVCRLVPNGVVCLLSALRFHGLTTQNPFEVWLAIDQKAWRPKISHPRLRLTYLSGPALHEGIETHQVDGVPVRVFSAAKTVADCFKFRNKIGTDVAVEALRDYRRQNPKSLDALWRMAETDRVTRVIRPYMEALG